MARYKIEKEYIFSTKSYQEITQFLKQYPRINLKDVRDHKLNTALHQAAYNSTDLRILKKYLQYMQKYCGDKEKEDPSGSFKQFVNLPNQDGMTALHFAAYKGNFKALEMLCNYGADYSRITNNGQNVLHLAAQGGMVESFIYFQSLIDINCIDEKRSTPLHWACYMNNESIVTFLLAQQNIDVNSKDEEDQTALHLATTYGHTKLVKKLLRAGADGKIKNKSGQTPLKIARDNQFKNIQKILNYESSCLDCIKKYFNLKTVYKPQSRSIQKPLLYIFCLLVAVFFRVFLLQYQATYYFISYIQWSFYAVMLIVYLTLIQQPTRQSPQKYIDFLNGGINMKKICLACALLKPKRSFHCEICKKCIERYDHHCYWINNCVGRHNFGRFICFIVLFQCVLVYFIWVSVCVLAGKFGQDEYPINSKQQLQLYSIIYSIIIGISSIGFSLPIIALILVHINNLLLNRTTYQRYTKDKISTLTESTSHLLEEEMKSKKQNKHSIKNVIQMCKGEQIGDQNDSRQSQQST